MKFKKIRRLIIFDFDDTLVKTEAKIRIPSKGLALSSSEFARIELGPEDKLDLSDFQNSGLVKPQPTDFLINEVPKIIGEDADILILTARSNTNGIKEFLSTYLHPHKFLIKGGNPNFTKEQVASMKKNVINSLLGKYDEILFYDDSVDNIELVKGLKNPKIKTYLIKTKRAK